MAPWFCMMGLFAAGLCQGRGTGAPCRHGKQDTPTRSAEYSLRADLWDSLGNNQGYIVTPPQTLNFMNRPGMHKDILHTPA
ncbi:hypothetical protein DC28_11790 [Spirochaeta lutea]|uniref:Uncharacterized protein n=1 Tax=Spirochaeta lutea TaxID=1480694 RepID=A0A098QY82_9SPIO|nr:hypothetical protein DC28_11790 [Spirochaeta lutea]